MATDILAKLHELNTSNLIEAYVPSVDRSVKFKQISVRQQKDIIKSSLDGILSGITLNNIINSIITDNAVDQKLFLVTDKVSTILSMRVAAFGSTYTLEDGKIVDLSDILKSKPVYGAINNDVISFQETIRVQLSIPDLAEDTVVNNSLIVELKKNKDIEAGDAMALMYIYEIAKFIKSVSVDSQEIDFRQLKLAERLQIVESMPVSLNNEITSYIQQLRKIESDYLTLDGVSVLIDARMFTQQ